jgi:hypothetical protein
MLRRIAQVAARLCPPHTRRILEDALERAGKLAPYAAPAPVALRIAFRPRMRVLFHPKQPSHWQALYKICALRGDRVVTDPAEPYDFAVHFTIEPRPCTLPEDPPVLNRHCLDVSKRRVAAVFEEVFGYPLALDPLTWQGPLVEKSDRNYTHDGRILHGPLAPGDVHPDRVYQRLVDAIEDGHVLEFRTPIYGGHVPVVFPKRRRFVERVGDVASAEIARPETIYSPEELTALGRFAAAMRLDYGELDVLRDRADGRIYVVDVNPTPEGPRTGLSPEDKRRALRLLADAFDAYLETRLSR